MDTEHIIAFSAYFALLFSIGLYSHKAQKTSKDFIMGDRALNYWVTAFSAHASDMSGWLFMAFPAAIFLGGLTNISIGFGLLLGMFFNWQFVAIKLRVETEKYESYTLSTYFERKFHDDSGFLRVITALMSVIFLTFYLSAGLIAMGFLLESLFDVNYYLGLSIAMFVAMTYTMVGGYYTVAKVDQFQAIFLLIMILIVPTAAFISLPEGFDTIRSAALSKGISIEGFREISMDGIITTIIITLGWGLGYFGQPHIITKFMGIKCPDELRKSKYVGMTWQVTALAAATFVGIVGVGFFPDGLMNPELVFAEMVQILFNPLIAGFILCGVIAANISTMDSQILVCASVLSEDFYKHIFKTHATERELLFISRAGVVLVSLCSLMIAFMKSSSVLEAVLYAWSGLGSAFGPILLMSLWWKKCNRNGAIAGILVGGFVAGVWPTINTMIQTKYPIPSMIPGFTLSLLAIIIFSLFTGKGATLKEQPKSVL
jgi:sodium/proline symporter